MLALRNTDVAMPVPCASLDIILISHPVWTEVQVSSVCVYTSFIAGKPTNTPPVWAGLYYPFLLKLEMDYCWVYFTSFIYHFSWPDLPFHFWAQPPSPWVCGHGHVLCRARISVPTRTTRKPLHGNWRKAASAAQRWWRRRIRWPNIEAETTQSMWKIWIP